MLTCFFVEDFSGTIAPRILKFGTNIGYGLLYSVMENQLRHAYHFLYLPILSFSPINCFIPDFSGITAPRILKFGIKLAMTCCIGKRVSASSCLLFHLFVHFFLSLQQNFSSKISTAPRILKFGTIIGFDLLYCVRENQHPHAYHSLYFAIFLFLQ